MTILNLTQHRATAEQLDSGIVDLPPTLREELANLITFRHLPEPGQIRDAARKVADIAISQGAKRAMIGGMPALMGPLEAALVRAGIVPLYAFSERVSEDQPQQDGSVKKVAVFRHMGLYPAALSYAVNMTEGYVPRIEKIDGEYAIVWDRVY